ncbi:MAG: MATE family efflux transporter [Marinifilaceae bacterium]
MNVETNHKKIWKIAYPIILGSIAQNIIAVTDTAFLGRVGEVALGAAAIAGIFYFAIVMLGWGFGMGTQIVIARRVGEKQFDRVGKTFDHALYFLLLLGIFLLGFMLFQAPELLHSMVKSKAIWEASTDYLNYRAYGIVFACCNLLFRALYIGIAQTRVISWSTFFMAIVNILLDYALIFGKWGLPEMGIQGAALASVIAEASVLVFFLLYTLKRLPVEKYKLFGFGRLDWELYGRLFKVSFPMMLQNFLSLSCWFIFFVMVESMGEHDLAISNIIRSIYVLLMLPVWAFASAANTLVSQVIGEGRPHEVMGVIWRTIQLSFLSVVFLVIASLFFPELIISIYTEDGILISDTLPVLYVICGSAILFPVSITLFHGVSGTGNTLNALILEIFVLGLYLLGVWVLTNILGAPIHWVWTAEYFYAIFLGIFSFAYLRYANWQESQI